MIPTSIYPVGILAHWRHHQLRYGLRRYLWDYCIRGRRWRAARNYLNGYLAEHEGHHHNAGRGWTQHAALRRVNAICEASA